MPWMREIRIEVSSKAFVPSIPLMAEAHKRIPSTTSEMIHSDVATLSPTTSPAFFVECKICKTIHQTQVYDREISALSGCAVCGLLGLSNGHWKETEDEERLTKGAMEESILGSWYIHPVSSYIAKECDDIDTRSCSTKYWQVYHQGAGTNIVG